MDNPTEKLSDKLDQVNVNKMETYLRMHDRILLHALAANLMSPEARYDTLNLCDKVVKKAIDSEAQSRTALLQGTAYGRACTFAGEPDGEDERLEGLKAWNLAKEILKHNIDHSQGPNNEF